MNELQQLLFLLCLALHPDAPGIFAVDSFDHAMHPRLARETTRLFSKTILEQNKTVFVTTHNPLAQILFDAETQCVLQVLDNTGGGITNRQSGTGADYWYQKNTRAAAVIPDSKCNGLAQRRSDADIRKQAQHHPAYTEADILFVAAEQAEKILVYHSIFPHGLFAPVRGRKFQISVN